MFMSVKHLQLRSETRNPPLQLNTTLPSRLSLSGALGQHTEDFYPQRN